MLPSGDSATSFAHSAYSVSWRIETVTSATRPRPVSRLPSPESSSEPSPERRQRYLPSRKRIVPHEHRLIASQPRARPVAYREPPRAPRRERRVTVVIGIDHVAAHFIVLGSRDREAERVAIRRPHDISAAARRKFDVPPRPRIHFQHPEHAVALVLLELGREDAAIAEVPQQPHRAADRAGDLVEWHAHHTARVAEVGRIHAEPAAREHHAHFARSIDVPVHKVVSVARPRDVLLQDHREAGGGDRGEVARRLVARSDPQY